MLPPYRCGPRSAPMRTSRSIDLR